MTDEPTPQQNDGWSDIEYDLGRGPEINERIGQILNEACHVFYFHSGGAWASHDKDFYARQLMPEIRAHPSLIGQLKKLQDRVVKMVLYRAIELIEVNPPPDDEGSDP